MSWVRRSSAGSMCYIYADIDGYWVCNGCWLQPPRYADHISTTAEDMAEHIRQHVEAGHLSGDYWDPNMDPARTVAELEDEMA